MGGGSAISNKRRGDRTLDTFDLNRTHLNLSIFEEFDSLWENYVGLHATSLYPKAEEIRTGQTKGNTNTPPKSIESSGLFATKLGPGAFGSLSVNYVRMKFVFPFTRCMAWSYFEPSPVSYKNNSPPKSKLHPVQLGIWWGFPIRS